MRSFLGNENRVTSVRSVFSLMRAAGSRIWTKKIKFLVLLAMAMQRCSRKWFNLIHFDQGFGSGSVSGSAWIRINLSCWIRIRIQEGKNDPKNRKKDRIFILWSAGCSLLGAEGFSCSLGILYGGPGISKVQFFIQKIKIKFLFVNFFQF